MLKKIAAFTKNSRSGLHEIWQKQQTDLFRFLNLQFCTDVFSQFVRLNAARVYDWRGHHDSGLQ